MIPSTTPRVKQIGNKLHETVTVVQQGFLAQNSERYNIINVQLFNSQHNVRQTGTYFHVIGRHQTAAVFIIRMLVGKTLTFLHRMRATDVVVAGNWLSRLYSYSKSYTSEVLKVPAVLQA